MQQGGLFPSLIPGGNTSGTNVSQPSIPYSGSEMSLGGPVNPFMPQSPGAGSTMPTGWGNSPMIPGSGGTSNFAGRPSYNPAASSSSGGGTPGMGANQGGTQVGGGGLGVTGGGAGSGGPLGVGLLQSGEGSNAPGSPGFLRELKSTFGGGIGQVLFDFLQSGAGYNPQVLQALYAQEQPGIERGAQQTMEQFSALGNRFGSAAGIGLGDYYSQVQANQGQQAAQLYEQSIQNYMQMLGALMPAEQRKTEQSPSGWDIFGSVLGDITGLGGLSGIKNLFNPSGSGGSSGGSFWGTPPPAIDSGGGSFGGQVPI